VARPGCSPCDERPIEIEQHITAPLRRHRPGEVPRSHRRRGSPPCHPEARFRSVHVPDPEVALASRSEQACTRFCTAASRWLSPLDRSRGARSRETSALPLHRDRRASPSRGRFPEDQSLRFVRPQRARRASRRFALVTPSPSGRSRLDPKVVPSPPLIDCHHAWADLGIGSVRSIPLVARPEPRALQAHPGCHRGNPWLPLAVASLLQPKPQEVDASRRPPHVATDPSGIGSTARPSRHTATRRSWCTDSSIATAPGAAHRVPVWLHVSQERWRSPSWLPLAKRPASVARATLRPDRRPDLHFARPCPDPGHRCPVPAPMCFHNDSDLECR
jgi:hypothetical protein